MVVDWVFVMPTPTTEFDLLRPLLVISREGMISSLPW
jgi:hypothetical protein